MKFHLQRLFHNDQFTCGFVDNEQGTYHSFCLEDTKRDVKIPGVTRFPAGFYELKIRKEETPLTLKHRASYNKPGNEWFKFHIEVTGIPGYSGCYIHAGIDDSHTEGCLLFMFAFDIHAQNNQGSFSTIAVEAFYKLVYPLLESGEKCFIEVKDEPVKTSA